MLVLSCRRGEAIHIADTVDFKVLEIRKQETDTESNLPDGETAGR